MLFPYETLKIEHGRFPKIRFLRKEADIIQDVLLTSDLFGIQSHGMQRMVRYHKGITNGLIKIDAKPEIVKKLQSPQLSTVMMAWAKSWAIWLWKWLSKS